MNKNFSREFNSRDLQGDFPPAASEFLSDSSSGSLVYTFDLSPGEIIILEENSRDLRLVLMNYQFPRGYLTWEQAENRSLRLISRENSPNRKLVFTLQPMD